MSTIIALPYNFTEPITQPFPYTPYISFPVKTFTSRKTFVSSCSTPDSPVPIISVTSYKYSFTSQADADTQALNDAMAKVVANRALNPCNPV